MLPVESQSVVDRLLAFQRAVREAVVCALREERGSAAHEPMRSSSADTIYALDARIDPLLEAFCRDWARSTPLVLVAEGLDDEAGQGAARVYPEGTRESDACIRLIVDPIDGTRGLMYDKRAAWTLAAVAPNRGAGTRLSEAEVAVMTELPTSKMGRSDVAWATKGRGARGRRVDLSNGEEVELALQPSQADTIDHGFVSVSNFFPGTKVLAAELVEHLVQRLLGPADITRATVFEDQYISTGGQFYELMVGHDRFNADLRPVFYRAQGQGEGMCCHPYDCAALLIAQEAGVVITDAHGQPLDAPMDTSSGVSWIGYANARLRERVEPHVRDFLERIESQRARSAP